MNDKKIELKACPFCGKSSAKIKEDVVSQQGIIAMVKYVTCEVVGQELETSPNTIFKINLFLKLRMKT